MSIYITNTLESYYRTDAPSSVELELEGGTDLTGATGVTASLVPPDGTDEVTLAGTLDGTTATIVFGGHVLEQKGMYRLTVTIATPSQSITAAPAWIVVEDSDGWVTLDLARQEWAQAPDSDALLFSLLDAAHTAVVAFAPAMDGPVPPAYRRAQLMQARAVWTASSATTGERVGDEEYSVTVWPLDWNVKQLLRPKHGVPVIF